jgi:hypothetical protein
MSDEPRTVFEQLSAEYAQAQEALAAIEKQAPTLLLLGSAGELLQFIAQFMEMAERVRGVALANGEQNFVEWFDELIARAERLRDAVPR